MPQDLGFSIVGKFVAKVLMPYYLDV